MIWTKAKTAVAILIGMGELLAAGTTILIIYSANKPIQGIPKDWSVLSGGADQWNWTNGKINAHGTTGESILASTRTYRDVTLSAIASTTNREASLAIRMQDTDNGYLILFAPEGTPRDDAGHITLVRKTGGQEVTLIAYRGREFSSMGQSAKITVAAHGSWMEVHLNNATIFGVKDTTFATGRIGLRIFGDQDYPCDATFSDVNFH
jgi:hypothetical protein